MFWLGTVSYLATPQGEIQQVRWELNRLSEIVENDEAAAEIAIAISKDGDLKKAQTIIANKIDSARSKAEALSAIAKAIGQLNQPQQASKLLKQALTAANQIDSSSSKASALRAIAEAYGQLDEPQQASKLLEQALTAANQIDDSSDKARALIAIAEVIGQLNQPQEARTLFQQALNSANQIDDSRSKASALRAISRVYAQLGNWGEARKASEKITIQEEKAKSLAQVLTIWNEKKISQESKAPYGEFKIQN